MVHAEQVQDSVHEEEGELVLVGAGVAGCLLPGDLRADDDVSEERWHVLVFQRSAAGPARLLVRHAPRADQVVLDGEGQHVGRPLPAEEPFVELGDGRLVDEHHRELGPVPDPAVGEDPLGKGDPAAEVDGPVRLLVGDRRPRALTAARRRWSALRSERS